MKLFLLRHSIIFTGIYILLNFSVVAQKNSEKTFINTVRVDKQREKFLQKTLALGEYFKSTNIHKADSIRIVLLRKTKRYEDSLRVAVLLFSAEINDILGNHQEYVRDIEASQLFMIQPLSERMKFRLYNHLGNCKSLEHEFETANEFFHKAEKSAIKTRNNAHIAQIYTFLSLHYMRQNNKDSALYYSDLSLKFGRRSFGKKMLDECLHTQALIYDHFGQIELSLAKNILAAEWAEKTGDLFHLAQYYREIGMSQRLIRNLDDADFYLSKALLYSRKIQDYRQMALCLISLGHIHYERKDFDAAMQKVNQSLDILNKLNDQNGLGEAYKLRGIIKREQKDYNQAVVSFNTALVYFETTGAKESIAEVYHHVGTVFIKQKKLLNALNYLERSVAIRYRSGHKNQIYDSYRIMSQVYQDLGQSAKALMYMQKYVNYVDSNSLVMAAKKIADLSENYRSEQRFRLIQTQADSIEQQRKNRILAETKLENSQLRNNFQLYIIIALLVVAILAGIIFFYRSNQVKIKQQQREAEMSQTLLRTQMNPHFVFNALSVIQSYIFENDTQNSSKFLVNFSRLMRLILENSPKEFISLETETEILQKYLETQKLRFGERFEYKIIIAEEILSEHTVIPPMITQPFIENAIEHGQLHTVQGGYIHVFFSRVDNLLQVSIEDNGIGRSGAQQNKKSKAHKSMALKITRERIENLNNKYGTEGYLLIQDLDLDRKTGTKVLISLPYREDNLAPATP
jgi:tetratricopeptide (TPR) repeat protein